MQFQSGAASRFLIPGIGITGMSHIEKCNVHLKLMRMLIHVYEQWSHYFDSSNYVLLKVIIFLACVNAI